MHDILQVSIDEWKSARAILSSSVRSYLSACTTLHAHYITPARRPNINALFEEALATISSELHSLELEEQKLRSMRISMAAMRNHSATLAPINTLPPKILSGIFSQSRIHCVRDRKKELRFYDLSGVCAYWRRIALDTAELWTHIDAGQGTPEKLTNLLLSRAKDKPVYMHVHEPTSAATNSFKYQTEKTLRLLAVHMHRTLSLDVETYGDSRVFIASVLNLWFSTGGQSFPMPRSLLVYRPNGEIVLSSHGRSVKSLKSFSRNAKNILESISTLHLQDVMFDWDSDVYRGLVDLRLSFPTDDTSISISQLASILSASPKLVVLKLGKLGITREEGESEPSIIILGCLEVLNLVDLGHDDVKLLLSLICVPNPSADLDVGLPACRHMHDELAAFFTRCRISTFYYSFYRDHDSLTLPSSFLPSLPCVSTLILHRFDIDEEAIDQTNMPLSSALLPLLPSVTLIACSVNLDVLESLVVKYGIQALRLERCSIYRKDQQDLQTIQVSLLENYPNLQFSLSTEDSISQVPCCMMFDR